MDRSLSPPLKLSVEQGNVAGPAAVLMLKLTNPRHTHWLALGLVRTWLLSNQCTTQVVGEDGTVQEQKNEAKNAHSRFLEEMKSTRETSEEDVLIFLYLISVWA